MPDPNKPPDTRIIAITNQKGGVGKTTTAINLAVALVETGARVLLVDLDPQGNASTGLGIDAARRQSTSYDLLLEGKPLASVAMPTAYPGLTICPANSDLASADIQLGSHERRSFLLRDALARNPDGIVLFASTQADRVAANIRAATDTSTSPDSLQAFREFARAAALVA